MLVITMLVHAACLALSPSALQLYIVMSLVLTGIVPDQQLGIANPIAIGIAATGIT